jgi:hypothetical protein
MIELRRPGEHVTLPEGPAHLGSRDQSDLWLFLDAALATVRTGGGSRGTPSGTKLAATRRIHTQATF